jgi:hypothetical protein
MAHASTVIETVSGRLVDLACPRVEDIEATDIAWALSREPRFGGHTVTAIPYSVGQHSIQVMLLLEKAFRGGNHALRLALLNHFQDDNEVLAFISEQRGECPRWVLLAALLHDASEAYLRDLPSPVKSLPGLSEAYRRVEKQMMDVIFQHFEVIPGFLHVGDEQTCQRLIHWADLYARTVEAYHFMPSRGAHWQSSQKVTLVGLQEFQEPQPALHVYEQFLVHLNDLMINK